MASVKVAVRVRPLNQREKDMGAKLIIQVDGKKTRINNLRYQDQFKDFTFDHSYWSFDENDPHFADQEQVFGDLGKDVVDAAFEGYNACVFAYGQTGSGKTFTMTGSPDKQGLIPRICESLFTRMASGGSYRTEVSYLEIYNERVKDLLREGSAHNLKVREHPRSGPYVSDLSRHLVSEYAHIQELMSRGNSVRTTASTNMNDTSSRSHAIFTLQFQQAGFSNDLPSETVSKVHLVDLAGSERADATGATGQRLKEGAHINKSLVTLGSVISALAELSSPPGGDSAGRRANVFIPYRDSVLTWLLKDSLGGNSKTIMIAAISPADCNHSETLSTLRYANRAKNIINKPTINEDPNVKLIKELRDEITKLRGLLGSDVSIETPQMLATLLKKEAQEKVLTEKWTEKWRETQKILQEQKALGLRKAAVGSGVVLDSDMPHLVGIDDNLLSTGVTLYHLKDGETVIGSSEAELRPDIVLSGVDLEEQHCSIVLSCGVASLVPRSSQALCWVNGSPVTKPTRLSQGCQILLGRNNMFRYNDPQEAEKLRKEGHASHNLSLSRLSLLSWSTNDLSLSQSSDNLISSCEDSEKVEELQHQKVEFLKQKEAFKLEQAEKEQDWEKEQKLKRGALELAQRQLEQERQQMEEAYEVQCRRLAEDWQRLEQRQAQSLARLRDREAELYKSRQLLQCERDEEIAAMGFEHKAMTDVKECIDMKKREFREFVTRQIQEVFSLNNNFLLPEDKIAPLSVLAAEKFCEGLCWLEMHSPSTSPHRESLPSWASLTATLKDGIVGEIVNHHREAISKLEAELNSRVQLLAKRENKIKEIDKQLEETRSRSSDIEISQEPTLDERTCLSLCSDHKLNVSQRKQMLRLELVPAGTDLPATHHSSPDTFHTAPSPSPPTHLSLHSPTAMSDSGLGLREDSDDLSSTTDDSGRHRTQLMHKKNSEKKSDEESVSKSMNLLMQKMTRQRLHIIRSLESDLDSIDTNQEINLLQDLKKEYVRLEKKVEKRGKENNRSCEESGDASSSQDESGSLCDTVKYSGAKQSSQPPHNSFSMSTQNFSPYYNSSLDVRHRMLQNRLQPPLNPTVNSMDHIPPYNFSMARSMPALNPSFDPLLQPTIRALDYQQDSSVINRGRWEELEPSSGLLVRVPTYVLRGAGSSTHYAYEVRIHVAGDYWAVLRRYSRFRELHLQLKQTYGAKVGALAFPPRRLFSRQAEWLARERRPILERYLQSLIKLVATIPQSPLYTDISKPALLQLSPFFRRGVFESSKYGTS